MSKFRFMRICAITLLVALGLSAGCDTLRPPKPPSAPALGGKPLIIWAPVNYWSSQGEKRLIEYIDACAKEGVGFGVEMAGWADSNIFADDKRFKETLRLYEVAVKRCRAKGIWMFVSIMNNNSHLTKYGNKGYTFTSVWPKALQLIDLVAKLGPDNQLVQPVAETQTADGRKFELECAKRLAGFKLVYNGGSRPTKPQYGWPYFAYHPTKMSAKVPRGCFAVSDCGSIILQGMPNEVFYILLHNGYAGAGNGNLTTWASLMQSCGAIVIVDYAFKYQGPADVQAMRYMKAGIK